MPRAVLTSKDFWSGPVVLGHGRRGAPPWERLTCWNDGRMGPGFVPHAVGWILVALGAVIDLKGFARDAERVVRLHLRPSELDRAFGRRFCAVLQPATTNRTLCASWQTMNTSADRGILRTAAFGAKRPFAK